MNAFFKGRITLTIPFYFLEGKGAFSIYLKDEGV